MTSKVLSKVIDNTICSGYLEQMCSFKHLIFLQTWNACSQYYWNLIFTFDQCQISLYSQLEKKTTKSNLDMPIKRLKSLFYRSAKLKPTVTFGILQFVIIKQTKNVYTHRFVSIPATRQMQHLDQQSQKVLISETVWLAVKYNYPKQHNSPYYKSTCQKWSFASNYLTFSLQSWRAQSPLEKMACWMIILGKLLA